MNTSYPKSCIILNSIFFVFTLCVTVHADEISVLEDFSSYKAGKLPEDGWKARNGDPAKVYSIVIENDNSYLNAHDRKGYSIQLFRAKGWKLSENHMLSWKWRAVKFPAGSDELKGNNDSVASVYVVFPKRWFVPESIKYIWSEKLPVGTVIKKKDHFPAIVIRSGTDDSNKWIAEERNVYEDYKMLFDKRLPSSPVAFGILTDSNDTKSEAIADYDNFVVYSEETAKKINITQQNKKPPTPTKPVLTKK